jgi:hypothetical protein
MISKRDSRPFLVKFPIGTFKDYKETNTVYGDEWQTLYGLISDPRGRMRMEVYGNELNFDKVLILNATDTSRMIDYDTILMIDNMPTGNFPKGDYYVSYIYPEYNREIVIGLNKVESVDMPKLYFASGDNILYFQSNFDKKSLVAYTKSNQSIPVNSGDYVWTREPADKNVTKHRYLIGAVTKVGMDEFYTPFTRLELISE